MEFFFFCTSTEIKSFLPDQDIFAGLRGTGSLKRGRSISFLKVKTKDRNRFYGGDGEVPVETLRDGSEGPF